jgi:predicted aspartyl protease
MRYSYSSVFLAAAIPLVIESAATVTTDKPGEPISFELYNNHIYVPVEINGVRKRFILDSGASVTALSERCARDLGLSISGTHEIENAGNGDNKTRISSVKNVSLIFADLTLISGKALVISMEAYENQEGRAVDGVIGWELFSRRVVEIDYIKRTLLLHDPKDYKYSGHGSEMPLRIAGWGFVRAKVVLADHESLDAELSIDTGSQAALQLNRPFAEKHALPRSEKTIEEIGTGVGGEYTRKVARVEALSLGDVTLHHPITSFSEAVSGASASSKFDGSIGSEILRRFHVTFDYPHKRLILERGPDANTPFEADMSGLAVIASGPDFSSVSVRRVFENSPAAQAGLLAGDVIRELNGKAAADLTLAGLRMVLRVDGQTVSLKIQRGDRSLETNLTTARRI